MAQLSQPATLTKLGEINDIMRYKVLALPALVINDRVKSAGRVPSVAEISAWLASAAVTQ